ncbi:hypothetical protein KAFR_0C06390 [Kazachstania africana CBS 2517]|uniref:PH domain-containing protein n=1 Tax=Kazachstania africana (strain ATCC 22294 / BCRC 22015 / CBS 2517 / CECT 1963 / NBRC 1671 / NRRL Y-8276) TaxID=1071382 RepID=H2ATD5_KAZAF|nr:hypothetical protein KAFR_0C06390 [Kazachstania africana CBS 2517]CCF57635.1 hypothetical protein KAFR_0C06390 [Kazachstania africana CBS 2517]
MDSISSLSIYSNYDDPEFNEVAKILQNKIRLPFDSDYLTPQESAHCSNVLFKKEISIDLNEFQTLLRGFAVYCDKDVLCGRVAGDSRFWESCKRLVTELGFEAIVPIFAPIFRHFCLHVNKFKEPLISFYEYLNKNDIFMKRMIHFFQVVSFDDPSLRKGFQCTASMCDGLNSLVDTDEARLAKLKISLWITLLLNDFPRVISQIFLQSGDEIIKAIMIERLLPSVVQCYKYMLSTSIKEFPQILRMLKEENDGLVTNNDDLRQKFFESNQEYNVFQDLNLLEATDVLFFLRDPDLSFKKTFMEHLLFGDSAFPLYHTIFEITKNLQQFYRQNEDKLAEKPFLAIFIMGKSSLIYILMKIQLRFWIDSGSKSLNDMESLSRLIPSTLEQLDNILSEKMAGQPLDVLFEFSVDFLESIDYKVARQYQLDKVKNLHNQKWSSQISEFNTFLNGQVHDYVRHQRLLQLQKGTWTYSENPLDPMIKAPKVYFIIVSDNHANLLVREFDMKREEYPIVEGNKIFAPQTSNSGSKDLTPTIVIPLKTIAFFEHKDISVMDRSSASFKMINLSHRNIYTEVKLLDKYKKPILTLYLDTKEAKFLWLDGLQLISPISDKKT